MRAGRPPTALPAAPIGRRALLAGSAALGAALAGIAPLPAEAAESVVRIGMTIGGIPMTTGAPDYAGEGQRFFALTMYDSLVQWDLSQGETLSRVIPGLATSWAPDPADPKRWIFEIREGVKFHDGSEFTAEAAAWNFAKILDDKSPQFDPRAAGQTRSRIPSTTGARALSRYRLEVTTSAPEAFLPYQITQVWFASPAQWEKLGRDWDRFAATPSGTGPWKLDRVVARERAEMVRNPDYWDSTRVPHVERLVLLPIPDENQRTAAMLSGQVDWIEAPAPDAIARLRAAGNTLYTNVYQHNWTWELSRLPGSPWNDIRVRKAANLAVDREAMKQMLQGLMIPAQGFVPSDSPWFGNPTFKVRHDKDEALRLMREAGHSPQRPLLAKALIASSGGGQMQPLPMNELIQQNLAEIGIKVEFDVVDWNAMIQAWRGGARSPLSRGVHSVNFSFGITDPFTAFIRHLRSDQVNPVGVNWGYFNDPDMDAVLRRLQASFDPAEQDRIMQEVHARIVDEALFLFVAHDVNPRMLSNRITNFVQPKYWNVDFSGMRLKS